MWNSIVRNYFQCIVSVSQQLTISACFGHIVHWMSHEGFRSWWSSASNLAGKSLNFHLCEQCVLKISSSLMIHVHGSAIGMLWHDISEVQCSLPNLRYEEFSGLCSVLKCKCIYNPTWVTLDMEGHNLAKLLVSHKERQGRS